MSDDIVDWLRTTPSTEWCGPMLDKAASEIEVLRKRVNKAKSLLGSLYGPLTEPQRAANINQAWQVLSNVPNAVPGAEPLTADVVLDGRGDRPNRKCNSSDRSQVLYETKAALEESVKLQSHYAGMLNLYDGGTRRQFASGQEWIERLAERNKG